MKALIVTAILTLLAGCASTNSTSGDTGTSGAGGSPDYYQQQDRIFNSWIS